MAITALSRSSASRISDSMRRAVGWAEAGNAERTLATLCTACRYRHEVHYAEDRIMPSCDQWALRDKGFVLRQSA